MAILFFLGVNGCTPVISYNKESIFWGSALKLVPFRNFANIGFKSRVALKMSEENERKEIKKIRRNIKRTGDHSKLLYDRGSKETAVFKGHQL